LYWLVVFLHHLYKENIPKSHQYLLVSNIERVRLHRKFCKHAGATIGRSCSHKGHLHNILLSFDSFSFFCGRFEFDWMSKVTQKSDSKSNLSREGDSNRWQSVT
jgi:hypothetical protein